MIAYGDVDLVRRVASDGLWTPGVFAAVDRYHCSNYYAHFGRFLLNPDYMMLPFAELPRVAKFVFETLGISVAPLQSPSPFR